MIIPEIITTPPLSELIPDSSAFEERENINSNKQRPPCTPDKTPSRSLIFGDTTPIIHTPQPVFYRKEDNFHNLMTSPSENYFDTHFIQICELGQGTSSKVYKCQFKDDQKVYAVKVSLRKHKTMKHRLNRVRQLQSIIALPPHPHLVNFSQAWEQEGKIFIQMELCTSTLDKVVRPSFKPLHEKKIWLVFTQILLGLHHMHENGLVHRDIKPENILQDACYRWKLGDFGHAIKAKSSGEEGDKRYMAYELLHEEDGDTEDDDDDDDDDVVNNASSSSSSSSSSSGGGGGGGNEARANKNRAGAERAQRNKAADIFSLGVTLLQMATLSLPPGSGPLWILLRTQPLPSLPACYSNDLLQVIRSMMVQAPDKRPTTDDLLHHHIISKFIANLKSSNEGHYQARLSDVMTRSAKKLKRKQLKRSHSAERRDSTLEFSLNYTNIDKEQFETVCKRRLDF